MNENDRTKARWDLASDGCGIEDRLVGKIVARAPLPEPAGPLIDLITSANGGRWANLHQQQVTAEAAIEALTIIAESLDEKMGKGAFSSAIRGVATTLQEAFPVRVVMPAQYVRIPRANES